MQTGVIKQLKENLDRLLEGEVPKFIAGAKFNEQERATYSESLRNIVARLNNPKLTIAVVGRQRSGKSTLMNALVNDGAKVSPVDEITCTNGLSLVSYSTMNDTAYVHMADDIQFDPKSLLQDKLSKSTKEAFTNRVRSVLKLITGAYSERRPGEKIDSSCRVNIISRKDLAMYVTHASNPANHKGVVLTEVVSDSPLLEPGIVLVDSPGIDANQKDTALAHMVAEEVDVTIMVYSKVGNLGDTEMEFLVQRLAFGEQRINTGQPLRRKVFLVQNDWAKDEYDTLDEHLKQCDNVQRKTHESIQQEWIYEMRHL
jgi:GTPase Era involved in 16S rRNA processing